MHMQLRVTPQKGPGLLTVKLANGFGVMDVATFVAILSVPVSEQTTQHRHFCLFNRNELEGGNGTPFYAPSGPD